MFPKNKKYISINPKIYFFFNILIFVYNRKIILFLSRFRLKNKLLKIIIILISIYYIIK